MDKRFVATGFALLATGLLGAGSLHRVEAQPPGGFGGGPPGGMMGGGRRGPRELTAAGAPVEAYAAAIKLNDKQKSQIKAIQAALKAEREKIMPPPGAGGGAPGGGMGGGMDFNAMRANFEKLGKAQEKADKDISAILNDAQKKALAPLLKQLNGLRDAGIPLEIVPALKLTDKQITQIQDVVNKNRPAGGMGMMGGGRPGGAPPAGGPPPGGGRPGGGPPGGGMMGGMGGFGAMRAAREKMRAEAAKVLTAPQKKLVDDWDKAHPRPQFGGMGGGRPGGGR